MLHRYLALIRKFKSVVVVYLGLSGIYILLILVLKPPSYLLTVFHLSVAQARALSLLVAIPSLVIWLFALLAYIGLRDYANTIKKGREWSAFDELARGVFYVALFLPVSGLLNEFANYLGGIHPMFFIAGLRYSNLVQAAFAVLAFTYMFLGSCRLLQVVRTKARIGSVIGSVAFMCIMALYVILVIHQPGSRHIPTYSILTFPNYESDILDDIVIIIPRLIAWFLGVLAVQNMHIFRVKANGSLYKIAFNNIAIGVTFVLIGSVVFRLAQDIPAQFGHESITLLVALSYLPLAVYYAGFAFLWKGSAKLLAFEQ